MNEQETGYFPSQEEIEAFRANSKGLTDREIVEALIKEQRDMAYSARTFPLTVRDYYCPNAGIAPDDD